MEPRLGTASTSSHNCNGSMRKEHQVGGKNLKPHSTPATLLWLEENYEMAEGVCVPRNTLYLHYVDFCAKHSMQPVNAASFGKIIRQQFPQLTTRRLGTRGQSRYHYYGIAIRETSSYYELIYSKKGIQATGDLRKDQIRQVPSYAPRGKMATRLPEFPSLRDLCLPAHVPEDRVATFIMMYRAHCQRLLDTVIRASFDEVQTFLLHFWQGMPPHLIGILGTNVVVNIVGVCDSILYRSVCSILMPSIVRPLPEALIQVIRKFATELDSWLRAAMEDLPENLRTVKSDLARHFCHMLRRQASLNQVMQASRLALHDSQVTVILLHDWRHLDLQQNVRSALQAAAGAFIEEYSFPNVTSPQTPSEILMVSTPNQPPQSQPANKRNSLGSSERFSNMEFIGGLCGEFERLLQEQVPIEAFTEWLETVVERCVVQSAQRKRLSLRQAAKTFLAAWVALSARLLRDLSLHSAPSFGSFNLLRLMADDYLLYLVELLHMDERARELMRNISIDAAPEFVDSDYETLVARMYSITDANPSDVLHDMNVGDVTSHSSPAHSYTLLAGDPSESSHHPATQHSSSTGGCLGNDMDPDASQTSVMGEYVHITDFTTASHCNAYSYDGDTRGLGNGYKFSGGYMYVSNGQPQAIPYSLAVLGPQPEISNAEYTTAYPGSQYGTFRRDFADPNTANYYPEAATYPVSLAVHGSPEYYASYDVTTYETANTPRPKSVPGDVKLGDSEDRELTPSNTYLSSNSNSSADTPYLRS